MKMTLDVAQSRRDVMREMTPRDVAQSRRDVMRRMAPRQVATSSRDDKMKMTLSMHADDTAALSTGGDVETTPRHIAGSRHHRLSMHADDTAALSTGGDVETAKTTCTTQAGLTPVAARTTLAARLRAKARALPVAALGGPGLEVDDLDWTGRR